MKICSMCRKNIKETDEIHVNWDGKKFCGQCVKDYGFNKVPDEKEFKEIHDYITRNGFECGFFHPDYYNDNWIFRGEWEEDIIIRHYKYGAFKYGKFENDDYIVCGNTLREIQVDLMLKGLDKNENE